MTRMNTTIKAPSARTGQYYVSSVASVNADLDWNGPHPTIVNERVNEVTVTASNGRGSQSITIDALSAADRDSIEVLRDLGHILIRQADHLASFTMNPAMPEPEVDRVQVLRDVADDLEGTE